MIKHDLKKVLLLNLSSYTTYVSIVYVRNSSMEIIQELFKPMDHMTKADVSLCRT